MLGLGLVGFGAKSVDYYRLSQAQESLKAQFTQEYRQIRPDDSSEILDPVGRIQSLRRGMGTSTAPQVFLPSLRELSVAMAANSNATVEAISYRAGVIDVRLSSPDVETIGNIQKAISDSGTFNASIQSTDRVADRINSRIQIREGGS